MKVYSNVLLLLRANYVVNFSSEYMIGSSSNLYCSVLSDLFWSFAHGGPEKDLTLVTGFIKTIKYKNLAMENSLAMGSY